MIRGDCPQGQRNKLRNDSFLGVRDLPVLVIDQRKRPLMPCSKKRARLLRRRRDRVGLERQGLRLKLDPGSKTVGLALRDTQGHKPAKALALFELQHRDKQISKTLTACRAGRKCHRCRLGFRKTPAIDAACVGTVEMPAEWRIRALKVTGRCCCCRSRLEAWGIARGSCVRHKTERGFQTGGMVRASKGKKTGTHLGRRAVRASGSFNVQTLTRLLQAIGVRHCRLVYRWPRPLPANTAGIRCGKIP